MKVSRVAVWAVAMSAILLLLGCGDTYRQIAYPVTPSGGDPQSFHAALVVNQGPSNGATSVIDTTGDTNIGNVVTDNTPVHAASLGSAAVMANRDSDTLTIQSVYSSTSSTPAELYKTTLGAGTGPVFVHPFSTAEGTSVIYVAGFNSGKVSVVNLSTAPPPVSATISVGDATSRPVAITSLPDGSRAYVLNRDTGEIKVISPSNQTVERTVTIGGHPVYALVHSSGKAVYVLSADSPATLKVIDPAQQDKVLSTVTLPGTLSPACTALPMGAPCASMFYDSTAQRLYIANYSDNSVSIFDTNTATNPQPLAKIGVDGSPLTIAAVAGGTKIYVLNQNVTTGCSDEASSGRVSVIDTSSNTKLRCITVAADPSWIAISSDGAKVLVPHKGGATPGTQVISTSTNTVTNDVPAPLVDPNGSTNGARMSPVFVLGL